MPVSAASPATSTDWDLAFFATSVMLNGGEAGPAGVVGHCLCRNANATDALNVGPGFGYVVRGNPDLQPESSRNVSGSMEWAVDRVYLRAQAFHNRFRDFIETREVGDSSGVTVFTYGNIDDGRTRGLELEAGTTWRGLRAEAGWGWLTAERAETGE